MATKKKTAKVPKMFGIWFGYEDNFYTEADALKKAREEAAAGDTVYVMKAIKVFKPNKEVIEADL